jgi:hypothetical protein
MSFSFYKPSDIMPAPWMAMALGGMVCFSFIIASSLPEPRSAVASSPSRSHVETASRGAGVTPPLPAKTSPVHSVVNLSSLHPDLTLTRLVNDKAPAWPAGLNRLTCKPNPDVTKEGWTLDCLLEFMPGALVEKARYNAKVDADTRFSGLAFRISSPDGTGNLLSVDVALDNPALLGRSEAGGLMVSLVDNDIRPWLRQYYQISAPSPDRAKTWESP